MLKKDKNQLKIARIMFPVKTLGPGNRLAIWFSGCNKKCNGCANPELWENENSPVISTNVIMDSINTILNSDYPDIDGITITGGEPFLQETALENLLIKLNSITDDILVFTGYKRDEIPNLKILNYISVLIDGPYIEEQNNGHPLKGSDNQEIYYLKKEFEVKYNSYIEKMKKQKYVQMFDFQNYRVATGIHSADFTSEYKKRLGEQKNEWT